MTAAHSPEPWSTENRGLLGDPAIWSAENTVCGVFDPGQLSESDPAASNEPSVSDARRIVACVNACAGITTSELETAAGLGDVERHCRLSAASKDAAWEARRRELRRAAP